MFGTLLVKRLSFQMAEVTRIDPREVIRRENHIREYQRPRDIKDPYTWPWPYRTAAFTVGAGGLASHLHNLWMRKPWHYGMFYCYSCLLTYIIL